MAKKKLSKKEQEIYDLLLEQSKSKSKPAKKKPIVSQRVKKIDNKIKYQQSKLREVKDHLKSLHKIDKRFKVNYEGKERKWNVVYNSILNSGTKINSEIFKLKSSKTRYKKQRVKKFKLKEGEYRQVLGRVWDSKDIDNSIFKNPEITHVNGIKIKKDSDEILNLLNEKKLKMSSDHYLVLVHGASGKAKLIILTSDDIEDLEND